MKTRFNLLAGIAAAVMSPSCQGLFPGSEGTIIISLNSTSEIATRASAPDVDSFILTVTDSQGDVVWSGLYGDSPDEVVTRAGTYTVSAVSCKFEEACYERPQYGDSQVVTVPPGGTVSASLICSQMNAGVRLVLDESFEETFPMGHLYMSGAGGELMYDYGETRTAFFKPGNLSVSLRDEGKSQTLFTRSLSAREMLCIRLSSSAGKSSGGVEIQVDTARVWDNDSYVYGVQGGGSVAEALSVDEARDLAGTDNVWVYGYAAGVATGTGHFVFEGPFSKNTNIVLGSRSSTTDAGHCLSVELRQGLMRDMLNLVDNPENKGRKLYLLGDIVPSYYGIPGLKNVTEYEFR